MILSIVTYSQWPNLTEDQARKRFFRRQKLAKIPYYLLKLRYFGRYLREKLLQRRP
jgi:hypothetical protein